MTEEFKAGDRVVFRRTGSRVAGTVAYTAPDHHGEPNVFVFFDHLRTSDAPFPVAVPVRPEHLAMLDLPSRIGEIETG